MMAATSAEIFEDVAGTLSLRQTSKGMEEHNLLSGLPDDYKIMKTAKSRQICS